MVGSFTGAKYLKTIKDGDPWHRGVARILPTGGAKS